MQILPWVFTFLSIFFLLSSQYFTSLKHSTLTLSLSDSQAKVYNELQREKTENTFLALVKNKPRMHPKPRTSKNDPNPNTFCSIRDECYKSPTSKMNLQLLFEGDHTVTRWAEAMLDHYYFSKKAFKRQKHSQMAKQLISAMQKKGKYLRKKGSLIESVHDLRPEDSTLNQIYTLMLKGSKGYTYKEKEGFPALEHLFVIDPAREGKTFYFLGMPKATFEAIYSKTFAEAVEHNDKERHEQNRRALTIEEVKRLFINFGIAQEHLQYFEFTTKPKKATNTICMDDATQILLEG